MGQFFRIGDAVYGGKMERENDRGCHHRSAKRAATRLIDAGDLKKSLAPQLALVCQQIVRDILYPADERH